MMQTKDKSHSDERGGIFQGGYGLRVDLMGFMHHMRALTQ